MADEPQTGLEEAEDVRDPEESGEDETPGEPTEEETPEDVAEDALEGTAPTTASGEAAAPVDPDEADEPPEGDDTTTASDAAAVPEDPSEEEEVHDVVTADELKEKEEAASTEEEVVEEVEEEPAAEVEVEVEEEAGEEAPAAAAEEEEEAEEEEAAAEAEEEEEAEEEAAAEAEEEEEGEEAEEEEPHPVVAGTWYAIQTYSGHENKVQKLIQRRIEDEPGETPEEKEIREVLVPTQEVMEIRSGKRVTVTKRLYPGYVLVNMDLNDRTMHAINNIQGVIKFVGAGTHPQPLRDEEIRKILGIETGVEEEREEEEVPFHVGQVVEVTQGPFSDFSGTVQEVYADKGKAKVEVSLFGRPTSVELDFTQLKGY